jgi:hypothetical protein
MKLNRPTDKIAPKTRMGTGAAPPKVAKHISKSGSSETVSPQKAGQRPMVRMGNGEMPVRIVKHVK